jgi:hypothetical protein
VLSKEEYEQIISAAGMGTVKKWHYFGGDEIVLIIRGFHKITVRYLMIVISCEN